MAEIAFETRLQRLFADPVPLGGAGWADGLDARAFAARVEARLNRAWAVRRLAVGTAGLAGGAVAVAQLAGHSLVARLDALSQASSAAAGQGADEAVGRLTALTGPVVSRLPFGVELLWMIAGMALLAAALLATRAVDEL